MKKHQRLQATYVLWFTILFLLNNHIYAQDWSLTGNAGLSNANFLGTTDSKNIIFKVNNVERGRLTASNGQWRFGSANNNAKFDSDGKLTFSGNGDYLVDD